MSDDEYDNVPDLFTHIDFDAIPELSPTFDSTNTDSQVTRIGSPASSVYSCDEDEMNPAFLEELDALEEQLVHGPPSSAATSSRLSNEQPRPSLARNDPQGSNNRPQTSATLSDIEARKQISQPRKFLGSNTTTRKRSLSSVSASSPRKRDRKGDTTTFDVETQVAERVAKYLSTFQDELTCPICCDYFAAAYMSNPCGHTFCGECGWLWIERCHNQLPTCPVCRTNLTEESPILPNITVDNTVQKHLEALQENGSEEWQSGGKMMKEWLAKKERWKRYILGRMQSVLARRRRNAIAATSTTTRGAGTRAAPLEVVEVEADSTDDSDYVPDPDPDMDLVVANAPPRNFRRVDSSIFDVFP